LAPDLDIDNRIELAAGGNGLNQIAAGYLRGLVLRTRIVVSDKIPDDTSSEAAKHE